MAVVAVVVVVVVAVVVSVVVVVGSGGVPDSEITLQFRARAGTQNPGILEPGFAGVLDLLEFSHVLEQIRRWPRGF